MADFIDFQETISIARRGMYAGHCQFDTKIAEVAMPAGVLVVVGANEYKCKLPTATGMITAAGFALGITAYLAAKEPDPLLLNEYAILDLVNFVKKGEVWVVTEGSPTVGAPAFVRFASGGGGTQLGAFRIDGDTGTAIGLPGCAFMSTATNGIARVAVNLPQ